MALQDNVQYQRVFDETEARDGICRGLADIKEGRIRSAIDAFTELDKEFGIGPTDD